MAIKTEQQNFAFYRVPKVLFVDDKYKTVSTDAKMLYGISENLNQVAVKANSLGFVDAPMLKEQINKLNQFQLGIESKYLRPKKSNLI